ncbi:MAG: PA2778 family cysteine peptidase [Desulfobacteraceae bacterium]|nr:PA2778 family cysteine peptidase [Desulfobacteraceae bacterium]
MAGTVLVLLLGALSGCSPSVQRLWPPADPRPTVRIDVPFIPQEAHQCGPAALGMALAWSGMAVEPRVLAGEVYSPERKGSLQAAMVAGARRHGRVAYPVAAADDLLAEVAAGHPVIVLLNLGLSWFPQWHYAVVVGYDRQEEEIILHSGKTAFERLSFRTFGHLWSRSRDWGLLVLPPSRLPAQAREPEWLAAVAGLEQAGQAGAALTAYEAGLKKWPESFGLWMGLGNSRYTAGDLPGAAAAFRKAASLAPESGMAFNNLAHVLHRLGQRQEALAAARKAVAAGGPLLETFRQTLSEIEQGP